MTEKVRFLRASRQEGAEGGGAARCTGTHVLRITALRCSHRQVRHRCHRRRRSLGVLFIVAFVHAQQHIAGAVVDACDCVRERQARPLQRQVRQAHAAGSQAEQIDLVALILLWSPPLAVDHCTGGQGRMAAVDTWCQAAAAAACRRSGSVAACRPAACKLRCATRWRVGSIGPRHVRTSCRTAALTPCLLFGARAAYSHGR